MYEPCLQKKYDRRGSIRGAFLIVLLMASKFFYSYIDQHVIINEHQCTITRHLLLITIFPSYNFRGENITY